MDSILQVFYSVFSGLILSAAIPNEFYLLGFPLLTLIALIPYYIAIKNAKNYRQAFFLGFLQAGSTHLVSSFWLANFKDFAALTLGASAIATGFFGGLTGLLQFIPYSSSFSQNKLNSYSFSKKISQNSCFRIIYFAIVYTIYEWIKSNGFLGYPWGTISSAIYKWPVMMQIADITGIYGISFTFSLVNAVFGEYLCTICCQNKKQNESNTKDFLIAVRFSAIIFSAVLIYGLVQYNIQRIPDKYISTVLVQQNSDPWKEKTDSDSILKSQELTKKTLSNMEHEIKSADLVVWSEGTLKNPLPRYLKHYEHFPEGKPLTTFIREIKTPLLTGGSWYKKDKNGTKLYYNSALVFDKEGNLRGHYAKNHLVPCAEAIPFMDFPAVRNFFEKVIHISAGWQPGDQYVFFDIPCTWNPDKEVQTYESFDLSKSYEQQLTEQEKQPTVKISCPVCFDDCFPDILRPLFLGGSEVFMNITDDSWSLKRSSEYQHFVNATYGAIEYRTTLVRSTNAGYSVVVDPCGRILADMPLFEEAAMHYDVPVYERKITIYAKFGNWLPYLLLLFCAVYCFYSYKTFCPSDYIPGKKKIKLKKNKKHKK